MSLLRGNKQPLELLVPPNPPCSGINLCLQWGYKAHYPAAEGGLTLTQWSCLQLLPHLGFHPTHGIYTHPQGKKPRAGAALMGLGGSSAISTPTPCLPSPPQPEPHHLRVLHLVLCLGVTPHLSLTAQSSSKPIPLSTASASLCCTWPVLGTAPLLTSSD